MQHETLKVAPLICLRCEEPNAPDAQFCIYCGAPLLIPDPDFHNNLQVSARTDVGQIRKNNEDNVALWAANGVVLALVADGMGGAVAGEEASRLTLEAIQACFVGSPSERLQIMSEADILEELVQAIQAANTQVEKRSRQNANLRGMGTTSTLALVRGNRLLVAHVGDSRAYVVDSGVQVIQQISVDHSYVQALIDSGHITPEQARNHPMSNVLYRALGQTLELDIDVYAYSIKIGDRILLCSDGLTKHVSTEEIAQLVSEADNAAEASQALITLANQRGGQDNISAVVLSLISA